MNMSISALVSLVLHSHPEPASQLLRLLGACKNACLPTSYTLVGLMIPFRIKIANIAFLLFDIISEKELIREKSRNFYHRQVI